MFGSLLQVCVVYVYIVKKVASFWGGGVGLSQLMAHKRMQARATDQQEDSGRI